MSLEVSGKIKTLLAVESGTAKATGNEWQKQNFIVSNNDGYEGKEQIFCFEVFGQEKVENLTKFNKVGDNVKVQFNIGTNEWKGKYFTSLSAWRIEKLETAPATPQAPAEVSPEPVEDLPF
jgi:hypothetical protein